MKIYKKSMLIEESDNVAVAVEPIQAGECTLVAGEEITANEYIKEGHKIARTDIEKGAEIIKYGVHIGVATQFIKKGDWVHEHNVYDDFEEINREQRAYYRSMAPDAMDYTIHHKYKKEELGLPETIMGYKRADGSFGIRNQVVVISPTMRRSGSLLPAMSPPRLSMRLAVSFRIALSGPAEDSSQPARTRTLLAWYCCPWGASRQILKMWRRRSVRLAGRW